MLVSIGIEGKGVLPFYFLPFYFQAIGESKLGRLVDALALGGDEGRDKLR